MPPTPKFRFYEKVRISSLDGELGAVLGMALGENGNWSYGVHVYRTGRCRSCWENDLVSIGEFDRRETFYSGESVQVAVDKKGRGRTVGRRPNNRSK
jgi:hypothetical protein